jgi:hypothetical protein
MGRAICSVAWTLVENLNDLILSQNGYGLPPFQFLYTKSSSIQATLAASEHCNIVSCNIAGYNLFTTYWRKNGLSVLRNGLQRVALTPFPKPPPCVLSGSGAVSSAMYHYHYHLLVCTYWYVHHDVESTYNHDVESSR